MAAWKPPESKSGDTLNLLLRPAPPKPKKEHKGIRTANPLADAARAEQQAERFRAETDQEVRAVSTKVYAELTGTPNHSGEILPADTKAAGGRRLHFLRAGSKPINGRPPSWVRDLTRMELVKRIPTICNIIDGNYTRSYQVATKKGKIITLVETPSIGDRIKAFQALGRLAGLESKALLDKDGNDATSPLANAAVAGAVGMLTELAKRLAESNSPPLEVAEFREA